MKNILTLLTSIVVGMSSVAAQNAQHFWKRFMTYFNAGEISAIHRELLSESYQAAMSEKEWLEFMKVSLIPYTGVLDSFSLQSSSQAILYFQKMVLLSDFYLDKDVKAEGLMFQPYQPGATEPIAFYSQNPLLTDRDQKVDSQMQDFYKSRSHARVSIALIEDAQVYYYHYAPENSDLPDQTSIYEIGSVTKTYTGLIAAQAIAEKKMSPEDDIRRFIKADLPELEYNGDPIRIKHLLSHTSGLPRLPGNYMDHPRFDGQDPYKHYTEHQLLDELRQTRLKIKPGTRMDYSNFGFSLLGYILMQVYGQDLETLFNDKLTNVFHLPPVSVHAPAGILPGYDIQYHETNHWTFDEETGLAAAGGIKSDIENLAAFIALNISEQQPAVLASHQVLTGRNMEQVAFGWMVEALPGGQTLYWHNGATAGFASFTMFCPDTKKGVVILSNTGHSVDELAAGFISFLEN